MEGMEIVDIPKLKLPRPDSDIADDSEVKRLILACWRGADELRAEISSTVMPKGKKNGGNAGSGGSQRAQQAPTQERPEPNKEAGAAIRVARIGIKAPAVPLMSHIREQRAKARKFFHEGRKRVQFTSLCVRVKLTLEIRHLQPLEKEGNGRECSRDGKKKCRYEEQSESVTPHEQL